MTLQEVRSRLASRLEAAGIEAYDYESWVFLDWKLGISRADYYMEPDKEMEEALLEDLWQVLSRREERVPLQYIMNRCDFMGYDFYVDDRVLIPRQDTECLIEQALPYLEQKALLHKIGRENGPIRILDMCTGSGCIGISLALLFEEMKRKNPQQFAPDQELEVLLSDLSEGALEVAAKNAQDLGAHVKIIKGNLFESLDQLRPEERIFDLIVSNPPYIPSQVVEGLMPEVRDHEPHMALDGTEDGLFFYRRITEEAVKHLRQGGLLVYEIGAEQGESVANLMKEQGFCHVFVTKDLAGLDRNVKGNL